ncbi:MAG: galactonate dehydratase [Chloroflexota bacterium]|nr:galactonate dehydratase [Chloroflexota bacterium]
MRITKVKSFPMYADRQYMFVKVETDEGIYGIGEAGITFREWAIEGAVRHLESLLVGQDPFRTEYLWQKMARVAFFPADKIICAAISAIDIALWDIKGKALNQPLYNLLGGLCRDKVVCYPHNRGETLAELLASCRKTVSEGWRFARWGLASEGDVLEPSAAVRRGVAEMEAVRDTVGPEIEICYDVHTRLDTPDAIRFCRDVEQFKPFFIEDPLRSENENSYGTLARHVSVPIAAGEQWATKWPFRAVIENEWIQYARIDLCIVGGITEALKVARWCEAHYIKLACHNPLGPVSTAACLHLDLASDNVGVQECPRVPGGYMVDLFPVQAPFEKGYLLPPKGPGLGIEFDEAAAVKYPYKPGHAPEYRRLDGSFTNW